jgi:quercetin dioxygenase-like cupin family protein
VGARQNEANGREVVRATAKPRAGRLSDHSNVVAALWSPMRADPTKRILLRGEDTDGALSVVESTMPAGAAGPRLHKHEFDEAFYVLDGELTIQVRLELIAASPGELAFAPRGVPHTLANQSAAPVRFLIVFTPAGFERQFARLAAADAGVDPPAWALQPIPEVTYVGPRIGETRRAASSAAAARRTGTSGRRR